MNLHKNLLIKERCKNLLNIAYLTYDITWYNARAKRMYPGLGTEG